MRLCTFPECTKGDTSHAAYKACRRCSVLRARRECSKCGRLYSEGPLITTDWAYWAKDSLTCPGCRGIDVGAEMERTMAAWSAR